MKIEPGKMYKLRNGIKFRCYAVDGMSPYPIHGARETSNEWVSCARTLEGLDFVGQHSILDIIAEWSAFEFDWSVLPKWADRWVAQDATGKWFCFTNKPELAANGIWETNELFYYIPPPFSPEFTGDWKDSLRENPKYQNANESATPKP